jgi:hypothetical protein
MSASGHIPSNGEMMVKVKVKFTVEQATKVQRVSRGIALIYL